MIQSKCKGCTERHINCHADCLRYAEFKANREEEYKRRKAAVHLKAAVSDYFGDNRERALRRHGYGANRRWK